VRGHGRSLLPGYASYNRIRVQQGPRQPVDPATRDSETHDRPSPRLRHHRHRSGHLRPLSAYRLREIGQTVRVFEAGTGVGGTWYCNRYPGCRFDSESYSYGYSFSQELLDEWSWTEHFAPQPQTERYLNYVANKFDLRRDIQFKSRVKAAIFEEALGAWEISLEDGRSYRSRQMVTANGPLSAPTLPRIAGIDDFQGEAYHTGLWPKHPVHFEGKRVAVIGTGA
jgi:cation diffusion facilitator CzcD-associated flavoprotein CzcO